MTSSSRKGHYPRIVGANPCGRPGGPHGAPTVYQGQSWHVICRAEGRRSHEDKILVPVRITKARSFQTIIFLLTEQSYCFVDNKGHSGFGFRNKATLSPLSRDLALEVQERSIRHTFFVKNKAIKLLKTQGASHNRAKTNPFPHHWARVHLSGLSDPERAC
jgi:hypothetical protein